MKIAKNRCDAMGKSHFYTTWFINTADCVYMDYVNFLVDRGIPTESLPVKFISDFWFNFKAI